MFLLLLILSIFAAFVTLFVFLFSERTKKSTKIFCGIIISIALISAICGGIFKSSALKDPDISFIEIDQIYKTEVKDGTIYYVKEKDSDTLITVDIGTIYEGNTNCIVKYEYPNMTDVTSFLTGHVKSHCDLIVTDLNIKELPSLN